MLESKAKAAMQAVVKHLIENPKDLDLFKKDPEEFLIKMNMEFSADQIAQLVNVLGHLGMVYDDYYWCPSGMPIPFPFKIPRRIFYERYWDNDGCGNIWPRPPRWWPWPWKPDPTPWIKLIERLKINPKEFEMFKADPIAVFKEHGLDANQFLTDYVTGAVQDVIKF
jgi:hypothetical protein